MIVLDRVSKSYDGGRSHAVDDLSLEVREGETLVMLGSSGSGKMTVVGASLLRAHPELRDALAPLGGLIADSTMRRLNYEVDERRRSPAAVAREFLAARGLLK